MAPCILKVPCSCCPPLDAHQLHPPPPPLERGRRPTSATETDRRPRRGRPPGLAVRMPRTITPGSLYDCYLEPCSLYATVNDTGGHSSGEKWTTAGSSALFVHPSVVCVATVRRAGNALRAATLRARRGGGGGRGGKPRRRCIPRAALHALPVSRVHSGNKAERRSRTRAGPSPTGPTQREPPRKGWKGRLEAGRMHGAHGATRNALAGRPEGPPHPMHSPVHSGVGHSLLLLLCSTLRASQAVVMVAGATVAGVAAARRGVEDVVVIVGVVPANRQCRM